LPFNNVGQALYEGRLSLVKVNGAVISNSQFTGIKGSDPSDGIQLLGASTNVTIGPYNTFSGILESLCGSVHCDAIQFYGAGPNNTISQNYFENGDTYIMAPDGTNSVSVFNNVFDGTLSSYPDKIQFGSAGSPVFNHNTMVNVRVSFDSKTGEAASSNVLAQNNILIKGSSWKTSNGNGCTGCTFSYSLFDVSGNASGTNNEIGMPTFVGGANPTTYNGFQLTPTSLGYQSASDGKDRGVVFGALDTTPPVLTTILVSPATANVVVSTTQQYTATANDQNGKPLVTQPSFSWTVSGGGTINATTGLFTAGATPGGPYTVTATANSKSGTASVTVILTPPCVSLGNTSEGNSTDNISDATGSYINLSRFQAASTFQATLLKAKVLGITGKYKCAIYADNAGTPGTLLKQTAEVTNPATGWQTFALQSNQNITSGSYYWIAIWSDQKSTNAGVSTNSSGGETRWTAATTYGTWPTTLNTVGGIAYSYCIYADCELTTQTIKLNRIEDYVSIYPNPFIANFTLKITDTTLLNNATMKIYNGIGKEVKSISINRSETIIEKDELQNGIYFYNIFNDNEKIKTGKLIVQ